MLSKIILFFKQKSAQRKALRLEKEKESYDKKFTLFNILLNHSFRGQEETLLSEITIVAPSLEEAKVTAQSQINKANIHLGSRFIIEKAWKLKQPLKLKRNNTRLFLKDVKPEEFNLLLYQTNLKYLSEEFSFCKNKDSVCGSH